MNESLDSASTAELVAELLARIANTNGLDFCKTEDLDDLASAIMDHIA